LITDLTGLHALPKDAKLTKLILHHNLISDLSALSSDIVPNLVELDLTRNKIRDPKQLPKLMLLPKLKNVILRGNPFAVGLDDNYRVEILSFARTLQRIDGKRVTEEELQQAAERKEQREEEERQKEEEERLRKEEEERLRKDEEERLREEEEQRKREEAEAEEARRKEEEEQRKAEEVCSFVHPLLMLLFFYVF
jgi:flagellar biosynthesis GTPase FlhF